MSTVTLNYPDVLRVRRVPAFGPILMLSSFAWIAITTLVLVISAANAGVTDRAAVSKNSIAPIPVPTAPITGAQVLLTETATPAPSPTIIAVPVPTPPAY